MVVKSIKMVNKLVNIICTYRDMEMCRNMYLKNTDFLGVYFGNGQIKVSTLNNYRKTTAKMSDMIEIHAQKQ